MISQTNTVQCFNGQAFFMDYLNILIIQAIIVTILFLHLVFSANRKKKSLNVTNQSNLPVFIDV